MRIAPAIPFLLGLLHANSVDSLHTAPFASARRRITSLRHQQQRQKEQKQQKQQQQLQLQQLQHVARLQVRGGAFAARGSGNRPLAQVRGGRTSDAVVLAESLVETALQSGLIVGFVGGAEYLAERYVTGTQFADVARLVLWTAAVFLSGAATAGPRRWLEKSQLFNINVTLGGDWYPNLRKPWFTPPNWVFPIMWIPLKILQVFACYEMWDKIATRSCLAPPVVAFAVYKALGDVWNKVFFERRRLRLGTAVISLYYGTLLGAIKLFFDTSNRAGYLFAPTAAWVTVAACLQWSTWRLNRDEFEA